jgi:outer membrane receptor protein involved in Fe transport
MSRVHSFGTQRAWAIGESSRNTRFLKISKLAGVCAFVLSAAVSTAALADEVSSTGLSAGQTTQAAAQASDTQPIEEIMVTGSRITRSGFNTPTPVTAVSANELANMNPGQLLDSISELPQFAANVEPQTSGFTGSGGSNLNPAPCC